MLVGNPWMPVSIKLGKWSDFRITFKTLRRQCCYARQRMEKVRGEYVVGCFPLCQTDRSEITGNTWGKWNGIFRIKSGQPIVMAVVILNPQLGQRTGLSKMERRISVEIFRPKYVSGPPPAVIPNIPVRRNRNEPFHLNSDGYFQNLWHNGKHPQLPSSLGVDFWPIRTRASRRFVNDVVSRLLSNWKNLKYIYSNGTRNCKDIKGQHCCSSFNWRWAV